MSEDTDDGKLVVMLVKHADLYRAKAQAATELRQYAAEVKRQADEVMGKVPKVKGVASPKTSIRCDWKDTLWQKWMIDVSAPVDPLRSAYLAAFAVRELEQTPGADSSELARWKGRLDTLKCYVGDEHNKLLPE